MRRWQHRKSLTDRAAQAAGFVALAGLGVLLITQLDSLRRYFNIRRMSARPHPTPNGTIRPGADAPPRWGTAHWPVR
jgi:hypothetical protein